MPMTFARLLDPSLEDDDDPLRYYDARGEPLEDRFYLPCGIDPHKKVCHVAFVHPLPHRQEILSQRSIPNRDLQSALWLVQEGERLANQFGQSFFRQGSGPHSSRQLYAGSLVLPS